MLLTYARDLRGYSSAVQVVTVSSYGLHAWHQWPPSAPRFCSPASGSSAWSAGQAAWGRTRLLVPAWFVVPDITPVVISIVVQPVFIAHSWAAVDYYADQTLPADAVPAAASRDEDNARFTGPAIVYDAIPVARDHRCRTPLARDPDPVGGGGDGALPRHAT
jgi:hypothetical protein